MAIINLRPKSLTLPGTTITYSDFRYGHRLGGLSDGINQLFTLPDGDTYIHDLGVTIRVFVDSVLQVDVVPTEATGTGSGFTGVTLSSAPAAGAIVTADYVKAN